MTKTTTQMFKRSKGKIKNVLTLTQAYQYYIKDIPEKSKYNVEYKLYRELCETFNKLLVKSIVEENFFFDLPYRLGTIRIRKRKINLKNLKPDFGLFNKTGLKNKHLNSHTNDYYCRWYWNKNKMIVVNKTAYSFIPTRENKRYLARMCKEQGKYLIYFE